VSIEDERPVWSDTVDRELSSEGDIVGVVEELTRKIVNELRLKLGRTQRQYKTDLETYGIYLRARALLNARQAQVPKAIPLFEEVIRRDPSYAPARAALAVSQLERARAYPGVGSTALPPSDAIRLAEPLARRAFEIDPMLAEVHAAFGKIHSLSGRWAEAEKSFRHAIDLDPSVTSVYGDFVLFTLLPWGRVPEALSTMQAALVADPISLNARLILARTQIFSGLYDDALDNCKHVFQEDPDYQFADELCGLALMFKGQMAEALEMFSKRGARGTEHWIGYIHAKTGRRAEAEELALAAHNYDLPHRPAMIFAALGDKDRAFDALERLAALNPVRAAYYLSSPELATLHDDPRADILRRKLGFPR
jgi:tetratricopeptide (TPR) repeat protein